MTPGTLWRYCDYVSEDYIQLNVIEKPQSNDDFPKPFSSSRKRGLERAAQDWFRGSTLLKDPGSFSLTALPSCTPSLRAQGVLGSPSVTSQPLIPGSGAKAGKDGGRGHALAGF